MLQRGCKVRILEARHLVPKTPFQKTGEKSSVAGVYVLIKHGRVHASTEVCRDAESPAWQREVYLKLLLTEVREGLSAREAFVRIRQGFLEDLDGEPQSLNPFAKNFVPPESLPLLNEDVSARASLVLHLYVLGDNLVSRDLLGDVTVDLVPLLESEGSILKVHKFGQVERQRLAGFTADKAVAIDTWVSLRKTGGQLRLQILFEPVSSSVSTANETKPGHPDTGLEEYSLLPRSSSEARICKNMSELNVQPFISASKFLRTSDRSDDRQETLHTGRGLSVGRRSAAHLNCAPYQYAPVVESTPVFNRTDRLGGTRDISLSEFDEMARRGDVTVSTCQEQGTFDSRLLEVQEQYDFSADGGYREGRPDDDSGKGRGKLSIGDVRPEWPGSIADKLQLQRDMQFATWRARSQSIAWAEKLQSSTELQHVLRFPPAFGVLRHTGRRSEAGAISRIAGQVRVELVQLVPRGIPNSLLQLQPLHADADGGSGQEFGGAFEGGNAEPDLLEDVRTAIPNVEYSKRSMQGETPPGGLVLRAMAEIRLVFKTVVRVSGHLCFAEYHVQVTRESMGDTWFVVRRYSDFDELYQGLPRSVAAISPLPPKSWRSLSFLSMTSNFLEDRRVALEIALRRLVINAVRADSAVQADLRAFLGFPALSHRGLLAGVDAEVLRHLARMPPDLELTLAAPGLHPLPLLSNLRVVMWMLLSGAAKKSADTEERQQYESLVRIGGEKDWCNEGGKVEDYRLAATAFRIIDEDVNRTNVRDSEERERTRHVLRAFALKNPSTGYCQGMNSVALFLLRTAGERDDISFWLLDALATMVIPGHWGALSHISSAKEGGVMLRGLMESRTPKLLDHLDSRGVPPEVLACDFFLSLGCRALPPRSVLRVWDMLFWEGGDTLQYVALAVLRLAEGSLLAVEGASATSACLAKFAASMHDADTLMEMTEAEMARNLG